MAELYPWLKALHIVAVISWMAGLLYLPRLFVYHRKTAPGSESSETFKVMERRLLKAIMSPAMIVAWAAGLALLHIIGWNGGWMAVKAAAVLALTGSHVWLGSFQKQFARDERPKSERYFRVINEVPAVLMLIIVAMAVAKPF